MCSPSGQVCYEVGSRPTGVTKACNLEGHYSTVNSFSNQFFGFGIVSQTRLPPSYPSGPVIVDFARQIPLYQDAFALLPSFALVHYRLTYIGVIAVRLIGLLPHQWRSPALSNSSIFILGGVTDPCPIFSTARLSSRYQLLSKLVTRPLLPSTRNQFFLIRQKWLGVPKLRKGHIFLFYKGPITEFH